MTTPFTKGSSNTRLGAWGEDFALGFLEKQGLTLLARNFRTRGGEIDLVMKSGESLVLVEVKTRSGTSSGYPEEAVTEEKLEHLTAAAEKYLESHPEFESDWRLDVVAIIGKPDQSNPQVEWYENVG
jgi:putative endonuclease